MQQAVTRQSSSLPIPRFPKPPPKPKPLSEAMSDQTNNIYSVIQQIKDHCKWYFGHPVQVITFFDQPSRSWSAVVYPAESTLATAANDGIHLHTRTPHSVDRVVYALLNQVHVLIGECFRITGDIPQQQAPIVAEYEAKCSCVQRTSLFAVAERGSQVEDVVPGIESESAGGNKAEAGHVTNDCSLDFQAGSAQNITPDSPEQRTHAPPEIKNTNIGEGQPSATADSPGQHAPSSSELIPAVKSTHLPGTPEPDTNPTEPDPLDPMPASLLDNNLIDRALMTPMPNQDDHTRDLIREEISRVLAVAFESVPQDETYARTVIRRVLDAATGSPSRSGT